MPKRNSSEKMISSIERIGSLLTTGGSGLSRQLSPTPLTLHVRKAEVIDPVNEEGGRMTAFKRSA